MRIGELARRTGVSERLLRYYEEQGLLDPARRSSGYREYTDEHIDVVANIRSLLAAGLSTSTIAVVLPCLRPDGDHLVPTCPVVVGQLRDERERIRRAIDDLRASERALDRVITAT
ncbi:MerR family transcriptional regulator [Nonomuraea longicatena]|uniref:MerR family transcriptional regulator n=1 Tax=Nonomuraea longicatena TaxID=83682 RepID=A0ABN1NU52_9ACTN